MKSQCFSDILKTGMQQNIWLLDYGAGNVRSIINAFTKIGHGVELVKTPEEIANAPVSSYFTFFTSCQVLVFPGVGSFGACMAALESKGFLDPLLQHLKSGKPFLGICLGMQSLFEVSFFANIYR
jgi:glutamine amidotransferase/cyclase